MVQIARLAVALHVEQTLRRQNDKRQRVEIGGAGPAVLDKFPTGMVKEDALHAEGGAG
jgi:hypothetical protein